MSSHRTILAVPALVLLFAAACAGPAAPAATVKPVAVVTAPAATATPPPPAVTPSPAPATVAPAPATAAPAPTGTPYNVNVPTDLLGTWKGMLTGTTASSGQWTMEVTHNEMTVTNPRPGSEPFPLGVTDITADHVSFWADPDCPDQGTPTEGMYTYAVEGDQMTFTLIADSCGDRTAVVTRTPWERQP